MCSRRIRIPSIASCATRAICSTTRRMTSGWFRATPTFRRSCSIAQWFARCLEYVPLKNLPCNNAETIGTICRITRASYNSVFSTATADIHDRLRTLGLWILLCQIHNDLKGSNARHSLNELVDIVVEKRDIDFIEDFAAAIPGHVIGSLIGVPADDCAKTTAVVREHRTIFRSRSF